MTLWLVGMMGTGKSSSGRLAASKLGVLHADTDEMVEDVVGKSIAEVWASSGEEEFRALEAEAVASAATISGIVSTGGGVVLTEANRQHLRKGRAVVWLDAPVEVIEARLSGETTRPGLVAAGEHPIEFLNRLITEREHQYLDVATHRIGTEHLEPGEVAARIIEIWND